MMSTTVRVKPSRKNALVPPPPTPLSIFDTLMPPVYVPLFLFFRPSTLSSSANPFAALGLISGLADVLEYFPPFAGSIRSDEAERLCVYSDNRGADFIYEFRDHHFPGEHAENLSPRGSIPGASNKDETLLAVKFTSFSCGSHVLVISFSHHLVDLASAMDFLRAFASQTIGQPLSTVPRQWTRNLLQYFPDAPALTEVPGTIILSLDKSRSPPTVPAPSEQIVFHIPVQKLAELKSKLGLTISNFQLLAAVLWRASATFCLEGLAEDEFVHLGIAANGRERSPDKILSKEHYFGNFVVDVVVQLRKSDVVSSQGFPIVCSAIKMALREQLTVDYIAGKGKILESVPHDRVVQNIQTRLTSWPKELLDSQELHFGLVKPGKGTVSITPGADTSFPVGTLHVMNVTEDVYRVQIAVPEGRGGEVKLHEELRMLAESNPQDPVH